VNGALPDWDGDTARLRALQDTLARQVALRDGFRTPLRTVAGFDVGFEDGGATTRAAAVLLDANTLEVLDLQLARLPTRMPYVPGLLSFRELPALMAALAALPAPPDLAFIDGQGIAHPRRLGLAAHFGVATGLPSIGVAKKVLVGEARLALHEMRGAFTPLRHGEEQVGWLLRSKPGCLPLVVSPGHRVALASAPELVMRYVTGYRLPEPTRLADRLASRRDPRAADAPPTAPSPSGAPRPTRGRHPTE
jgi:deoxyribonuclease V